MGEDDVSSTTCAFIEVIGVADGRRESDDEIGGGKGRRYDGLVG